MTDRLRLAVYLVASQWSDALGEKRVKYECTGVEAVWEGSTLGQLNERSGGGADDWGY